MTRAHPHPLDYTMATAVCFLAPELLPNQGGVGTYCVELLRGMAGRADLTVLTPERRKGSTVYDKAAIEEYFDYRFQVETISTADDTFLYNLAFQRAVRSYLNDRARHDRFDIIHAQHAHMPDLLWDAARHGAKTVRTIHSTIEGQREGIRIARSLGGGLQDSERWQLALAPVLQVAEWTVLQRPRDHYIAVSEWNRRQLMERGIASERIDTVHCGGDPVRYSPALRDAGRRGVDPSTLTVLFPGRPTLVKGSSVVAQALPEILRRVPQSRFVFTGGGAEEFLALVDLPAELRSRIEFRGYVPYDSLPQIYAGADLVIAPTYYDSFPIRILEALASGVPVVASAIGGIPESVLPGVTGRLIPSGDSAALTEAVVGLLVDAPLRKSMGQNGRRLVEERFSWQRAADSTLALYTRLAAAD
jgi:glycosyltransferase involved in cell wall biosynthesis